MTVEVFTHVMQLLCNKRQQHVLLMSVRLVTIQKASFFKISRDPLKNRTANMFRTHGFHLL